MIIVANFGMVAYWRMPQNPAYLSVSRKALEKIWQLEDILLLLVLNRKTSNVKNMELIIA